MKPQAIKLPYVFRMNLPHNFPPLKELLVQDYRVRYLSELKRWLGPRLGWLRIRNGQIHFEPFAEGLFAPNVLPFGNSAILLFHEMIESPKNPLYIRSPRCFAFRFQSNGKWRPIHLAKVQPLPDGCHQNAIGDFDGDGLADIVFRNDGVQMAYPPLTVV